MSDIPHRLPLFLLLAVACTFGLAVPANARPFMPELTSMAQKDAEEADFLPITPDNFRPAQHGLDPNPLVVDALGLAMYRPARTTLTTDRAAGQLVLSIHDGSPTPGWSVTVQHLHTSGQTDPRQQITEHLAALRHAGLAIQVIHNEPFLAGATIGHLAYIQQQANENDSIISGWLILPAAPDVLLVFSILAMPEELPMLRNVLEQSFRTINLRSATELSLERRSRIEAGRSFLESITPDRLRSLIGTSQWSRIYIPDTDSGEQEVGYSLLEVFEAKRGSLNPERPESEYSRSERVEGIMVRLQGRVIGDASRGIFYDSIAMYWMAWDQSEEAWSVRGTQRQGQATRSEAETGIRLAATPGLPQPTLQVIRQRSSDYQRNTHDWSVPDVYLSQALGALLGRLLARDDRNEREMAYYFYNYSHATPQLTQRIDRWAPADDRSGNWTLTTRLTVDSPPIVTTFSNSGQFLRTQRMDGSITTPTTLDQLRRLWQRKGLPLGQ